MRALRARSPTRMLLLLLLLVWCLMRVRSTVCGDFFAAACLLLALARGVDAPALILLPDEAAASYDRCA